ncbi:hypothetical protein CLAIMM_08139 [Cladophialophora immunda]|nr:hypothetical protein CLAIMM_08139 [Cladophialophora immunda]
MPGSAAIEIHKTCETSSAQRPTRSHIPIPVSVFLFTPFPPSHPDMERSWMSTFELSHGEQSDRELAAQSNKAMCELEENDDVFICIAHDASLLKTLPLLNTDPDADINDWKTRGI